MIPFAVIRRFYITLIIISVTCFSTALSYKNYAHDERQKYSSYKMQAEEGLQKCKTDESYCAYSLSIAQLGNDYKEISIESDAVAFWWFLAGWISVAIMAGFPVITWIVTGRPFGTKQNVTPQ